MYQGNQPAFGAYQKLDNIQGSFNGVETTFPLTVGQNLVIAGTAQNLIISLAGVIQEPGVSYTCSGSNIMFTVAPAALTTFFGVRLGSVGEVTTVTDGTITGPKLGAGAVVANLGYTPQTPLVSGTNVKTVGGAQIVGQGDVSLKTVAGQSIVGSGNIVVTATSGASLDELEALIYAGL